MRSLLKYRIEQSHDTLREAQVLLEASALRGVVNRAYYAMFYVVLALLATRQLGTSKHSAIISLFDREFVKPGALDRNLSRALHLAFDRRQTHDYGEMVPLTHEDAAAAVAEARVFVAAVENFLRSSGNLPDQATEPELD
jgi:uncharacterized protein (UPF0332 family)